MENDRHAYCIMAHNNWDQLQVLIDVLDDTTNDIYLHIDAKSLDSYNRWGKVSTRWSNLKCIKSHDVRWSDISQADVEVDLFREALLSGESYARIHLISGVDLPLKPQRDIHTFFKNRKEEFIDVCEPPQYIKRIKYYHFFVRNRRKYRLAEMTRKMLILLQLPFINRLRHCPLKYAYGANWCSLTQKAVKEIVDKWPIYRPIFTHSTSCDELYKQMILSSNSSFVFAKEGNLRYVDFSQKKPSPKTLLISDYEKMMKSNCLFARKFDLKVDKAIVDKIKEEISY